MSAHILGDSERFIKNKLRVDIPAGFGLAARNCREAQRAGQDDRFAEPAEVA